MELRAIDNVSMSSDLTPPLRPIAAALHPQFLQSHCSSCFLPKTNTSPPPPLSCCSASLRYCSSHCLQLDSSIHLSSGECNLIQSHDSFLDDDSTDLRVALRLLHSFEKLGVERQFGRFGGLLSSSSTVVVTEEEDWDMERRVKERGMLMAAARGGGRRTGDGELEEAALWAVVINGVDVLELGAKGGGGIGVAVYGPMFSWFNHSCSPNACYRFETSELVADDTAGLLKIYPRWQGEEKTHLLKFWNVDEQKSRQESPRIGPRIIVRSIKPILKHEEVCITYTDLLQPRALRKMDLWVKYRFSCCCCRCIASPETYVDRMLSGRTNDMMGKNSDGCSDGSDKAVENISNTLDLAIVDYLSCQKPKAFCEKIERILLQALQYEKAQALVSRRNFRFHPLHHMAISAYIALASAYKIQMTESFIISSDSLESYCTSRATIGYSLLLAGAINHLFFSEMSLVGAASIFWINAGENLVNFLKCSMSDSARCFVNEVSEFLSLLSMSDDATTASRECLAALDQTQFLRTCLRFTLCIKDLCLKVWPSLSACLPYMKDIKDPVDFSWTGITQASSCYKNDDDTTCIGCRCGETVLSITGESKVMYELGIHCILYGGHLAGTCYGSDGSLLNDVKELVIRTEQH